MKVLMRLIWDCGHDGYGAGRGTLERERAGVLHAGYRVIPDDELLAGERAEARSSGIPNAVVIETLADARFLFGGRTCSTPAGTRYALGAEIEPERGEE